MMRHRLVWVGGDDGETPVNDPRVLEYKKLTAA